MLGKEPIKRDLNPYPYCKNNDAYWSIGQLVNRRDNIINHILRLRNQLHEQICVAYPSYKQFFTDIGRPTALYFWENYPSEKCLRGKTVEDLAEATLYFLSIQQIQISCKDTPRNPIFRKYYEKRLAEGKSAKKVLICISRRLVNIIYGMMKYKTEYRLVTEKNQ